MHYEIISHPNVELFCITQMPVNLQSYQILNYFCTQGLRQHVHSASSLFSLLLQRQKEKHKAVNEEEFAKRRAKIAFAACA